MLTTTMILFTAVAIVREREHGNLELLITTPVRTPELMLAKIAPYVLIGVVQVTLVLALGSLPFHVPDAARHRGTGSYAKVVATIKGAEPMQRQIEFRKQGRRLGGLPVLLACCLAAGSDGAAATEFVPYPENGARLGQGWDSAREESRPNACIEFVPAASSAQTSLLTISEASDRAEVLEELDVSATASVKVLSASANAKSKFSQSTSVSSFASSFVVRATIDNGFQFAAPKSVNTGGDYQRRETPSWFARWFLAQSPTPLPAEKTGNAPDYDTQAVGAKLVLTPWALELARNNDGTFERQCGDSFVQAIYGGAEMFGMITIKTKSEEERREVSAEVTGSYGFVQASADFEEKIRNITGSSEFELRFLQTGGAGGKLPGDRAGFIDKLNGLAAEAKSDPKYTRMVILPYELLANWPRQPSNWPGKNALDKLIAQYWQYTSLYENMQRALDQPDQFTFNRGVTITELEALQDQVNAIRERLEQMARDNAQLSPSLTTVTIDHDRLAAARRRLAQSTGRDEAVLTGIAAQPWLAGRTGPDAALLRLANALATLPDWRIDPNWFLIRMPYPLGSTATKTWDDSKLRTELANHYFARPAKRQCRRSPSERGCLNNAEIQMWANRIVLEPAPELSREPAVGTIGPDSAAFDDGADYRVRDATLRRLDAYFDERMKVLVSVEWQYQRPGGQLFSPGAHGTKNGQLGYANLVLDDDEYVTELGVTPTGDDWTTFVTFRATTNKGRVFDPFASAGQKSPAPTTRFLAPAGHEVIALHGGVLKKAVLSAVGPVYRNNGTAAE